MEGIPYQPLLPIPVAQTDRSHLFCGYLPRALLAVCSMARSSYYVARLLIQDGQYWRSQGTTSRWTSLYRIQGPRRPNMPAWTYGRLRRHQLHGQHHGCLPRNITFLQPSPNGSAWAEDCLDRDISSYVTAAPGAFAYLWRLPGTVRAVLASKADPCRSAFEGPTAVRTTDGMAQWNTMVTPVGETTR